MGAVGTADASTTGPDAVPNAVPDDASADQLDADDEPDAEPALHDARP